MQLEIAKQKDNLNMAIARLKEYESQHTDYLPTFEPMYMSQFQTVSTNLAEKESQYHSLQVEKNVLQETLLKNNPVLTSLSKMIQDNEIRLNKMRLIYKESYSGIQDAIQLGQSLRAQREKLYKQLQNLSEENLQEMWEAAISANTKTTATTGNMLASQLQRFQNVKLQLKGMENTIASLKARKNSLNYKLNKILEGKQQWSALNRDVQDNQKIYDDLMNSLIMTKGTSGYSNVEESVSVKVVAYPQSPVPSEQRPRIFFFFVGILGGITLGGALTVVFELMDNTVRRKRVVEALTGLMVICRVEKLVVK